MLSFALRSGMVGDLTFGHLRIDLLDWFAFMISSKDLHESGFLDLNKIICPNFNLQTSHNLMFNYAKKWQNSMNGKHLKISSKFKKLVILKNYVPYFFIWIIHENPLSLLMSFTYIILSFKFFFRSWWID